MTVIMLQGEAMVVVVKTTEVVDVTTTLEEV